MASSKSRQRALARAKTERQIARRAAAARRRRQWQAGIGGAVALTLLVLAVIWKTGGFDPEPVRAADCAWTPVDAGGGVTDVGKPRTNDVVKNGVKTMTIALGQGTVTAKLDPGKAPCTVESFTYLAGKKFFDNTTCHRMLNDSLLQCGDPSGTGSGGPAYRFPDENNPPPAAAPSTDPSADPSAPADTNVLYPAGTVAMANSGADTNSSQFFLVFKDIKLPPNYTIFGTIVGGMDVLTQIGAGGSDPANDGKPKTEAKISSLTVTDVAPQEDPTPAPSAPGSAPASSAPASTAPSASASSKS